MNTLEIIFFILLSIVFYTYIGYGIILWILVRTAYNEEQVVEKKMQNCRELDYPKEKFQIVWVTDGSCDTTNKKLKAYPDATVYYSAKRKGKTAAMNRGIKFVTTPIVIFTDANTSINSQSIREMVRYFNNPKVGCVAGEKRINMHTKDEAAVGGEGMYWKYESFLKKLDSQLHSAVGAAGELFAIRTSLYEQMPNDTLLDDFILSLKIAMKKYIIAYCNKAYAMENGSANMKEEEKRKVRIAAGGIQAIYRLRKLLIPLWNTQLSICISSRTKMVHHTNCLVFARTSECIINHLQ